MGEQWYKTLEDLDKLAEDEDTDIANAAKLLAAHRRANPRTDIPSFLEKHLQIIGEKKFGKMISKATFHTYTRATIKNKYTLSCTALPEAPEGRGFNGDITAKRIFIATGTKPNIPDCFTGVSDITDGRVLTNENVFDITVPKSLIVIGGGAIACEMADAFNGLGSEVTMLQRSDTLLTACGQQAGKLLEDALVSRGVRVIHGVSGADLKQDPETKQVTVSATGVTMTADYVLFALGRAPAHANIGLDNVKIKTNKRGYIAVNAKLRTACKSIYAIGDCNGLSLFSHSAMSQAMAAIMNCMMPFFMGLKWAKKTVVPSTVFTTPQVSQVGKLPHQLEAEGTKFEVHRMTYEEFGGTYITGLNEGYIEIYCTPSMKGKILGVQVVGASSGELINYWSLAMAANLNMMTMMMKPVLSFPTIGFMSGMVSQNGFGMNRFQRRWLQRMCKFMW